MSFLRSFLSSPQPSKREVSTVDEEPSDHQLIELDAERQMIEAAENDLENYQDVLFERFNRKPAIFSCEVDDETLFYEVHLREIIKEFVKLEFPNERSQESIAKLNHSLHLDIKKNKIIDTSNWRISLGYKDGNDKKRPIIRVFHNRDAYPNKNDSLRLDDQFRYRRCVHNISAYLAEQKIKFELIEG